MAYEARHTSYATVKICTMAALAEGKSSRSAGCCLCRRSMGIRVEPTIRVAHNAMAEGAVKTTNWRTSRGERTRVDRVVKMTQGADRSIAGIGIDVCSYPVSPRTRGVGGWYPMTGKTRLTRITTSEIRTMTNLTERKAAADTWSSLGRRAMVSRVAPRERMARWPTGMT